MTDTVASIDQDIFHELEEMSEYIKNNILNELVGLSNFIKKNDNAQINKKMDEIIMSVDELLEILHDIDLVLHERLTELAFENNFVKYEIKESEKILTVDATSGLPLSRIERLITILDDAIKMAFRHTTMNLFSHKLEINSKKINNYILSTEFTLLSMIVKIYEEFQIIAQDIKNVDLLKIIDIFGSKLTLLSDPVNSIPPISTPTTCFSERKNNGKRLYDITEYEYDPYYGHASYD